MKNPDLPEMVWIRKDGEKLAKRFYVRGLVVSGSRGKEYQLSSTKHGPIERVCHAVPNGLNARTSGAMIYTRYTDKLAADIYS